MQNDVPKHESPLSERSVERSLASRQAAYREEIRRLMTAASDLMQASGSVDPRVGQIVRGAGLSNQAFYRHFRSKDELLLAILDDGSQTLCSYLEHQMQSLSDPIAQIRAWIEGVLAQALHPRGARATRPFVSQRARLSERFPEQTERWIRRIQAPLRAAIAAAAGLECERDRDPDADADADAVYHLVMGWVERRLMDDAAASRADARRILEFALNGLGLANAESSRGA